MIDRLRPRAAGALVFCMFAWSACAPFTGRTQYRALAHEVERAEAAAAHASDPPPFASAATLERAALVAEVLRRNPTIAAARHAWRAALARHPQETALDDPSVGYMAGPRSFDSPQIDRAQRIEASQAFPFPGKLGLRGAVALAEAEAMADDHAAVRLRLAAMASSLYDDYWLAARSIEINEAHLDLVRALRAVATGRYESGTADLQDPLRAEVEEAEILHDRASLDAALRVAAAQLAQLLHQTDGAALPPPPVALDPVAIPDGAGDAVERATDDRPELRAAEARVAARQAAERLAKREFLPDFTLTGGYDTFWEIPDQRPFVGIEVEVPLQIGRRLAALEQARAETAQARSEHDALRDEIATQVRTASENWTAARHGYQIATDRLLPASRDRLAAVRTAFETGRAPFDDVIDAERSLRDAELEEHAALAETSRRAAELLAALGIAPGLDAIATAQPQGATGEHHE